MKRILLIGALMVLPISIFAKSEKRGVSENNFQFKAQLEALSPGVSWYYTWGNVQGASLEGQDYFPFIPMCWNGNYNADGIREYCRNHPETKYLLGFNEPNFKKQANMTPREAADAWPAVKALADELGLELVAPVLNYSPDYPYYQPTDWMDEFVSYVGTDAFDYTAIHNYGGIGVMVDLATKFHDRYGKDVWVTEFCYWPGESGYVAPASQIASMVESLEWLEKTPWIHKYAWFKAVGLSSSPSDANYGLLITGRGEDPRELSEQGKVYVYMNDFDPEIYYNINIPVAATNYILRNKASLGATNDLQAICPIEITQFNSGATLDYQFDVPVTGEYILNLRVSGMGEPTRFDPNIGVVSVNDDESDGSVLSPNKKFSLSNDNTVYNTVSFPMTLSAGKQTIRIKDYSPYQPSGIRISTVTLADASGVHGISVVNENKPVNVYNLQGVCVLKNVTPHEALSQLPKGIYLIGGRKIAL